MRPIRPAAGALFVLAVIFVFVLVAASTSAPAAEPTAESAATLEWTKDLPPLAEKKSRDDFSFNTIGGSGPADVWVGGGVNNGGFDAALDHWDGKEWKWTPPGNGDPIGGIFVRAPADAWAVGGQGTIEHWDGSAWTIALVPATGDLYGVWGRAANDVWAVGDSGAIVRFDGKEWKLVHSGTSKMLYRVWGSSPRDVWAVGDGGTLVHWNGRAWKPVDIATKEDLLDVGGTGEKDVWVVGAQGVVRHFDGRRWARLDRPSHEKLISLAVQGRDDFWVTGRESVLHYHSGVWTRTKTEISPFGVWVAGGQLFALRGDVVLRSSLGGASPIADPPRSPGQTCGGKPGTRSYHGACKDGLVCQPRGSGNPGTCATP